MAEPSFLITRRTLLTAAAAAPLIAANDGWVDLFNGKDLDRWRASETDSSWKVVAGALTAAGPRSHLFYTGPVQNATFKNFELELETMARPSANSGVYFHTAFQEKGFPNKGFEVQINNTAGGSGNYRERKRSGSLYGLRHVYKQLAADNEWFKLRAAVRGKNIQVWLNGMLVVDYTEPTPPLIPAGGETERFLSSGTFALQCHDPGSIVLFRSLRVRPLPESATKPTAPPVARHGPNLPPHTPLSARWPAVPVLRNRRGPVHLAGFARWRRAPPHHSDRIGNRFGG